MSSTMHNRSDFKALTLQDLLQIIKDNNLYPYAPITMSSDEEGNEMLSLVGVEISKSGALTLWPARL